MFTHSVISIEPLLFARQKSFCFSKKYYKHFLIYWEKSLANVYEFANYFYTQREGGVEIKSMQMDWRTPLPLYTLTYTHTSILFYYSFLWEKTGRIRFLTTACRCQRSRDMKVVSVRKQPWSHLPWGERERRAHTREVAGSPTPSIPLLSERVPCGLACRPWVSVGTAGLAWVGELVTLRVLGAQLSKAG